MTDKTNPDVQADPRMDSAGAELMALAWRMKDHPEFAADADRVREIGAWASMGRLSDMEMMVAPVLGALVGTMRSRGIPFDEQLPMSPQFTEFLSSLADPLPGQRGYVDQATLPPVDRRDAFEAVVEMKGVANWTTQDGIERAVSRESTVTPTEGVAGQAIVYAEAAHVPAIQEGATATVWLRSGGGALRIVDPLTPKEVAARRRTEPVTWDELVQMFHGLHITLRQHLGVSIQDELKLDVDLRSFTCDLYERLRRSRQVAERTAAVEGDRP